MANEMTTVAQVEQQMTRNRAEESKQLKEIEQDKDLSPNGRARKAAEVRTAARERHEQLKTAHSQAVKQERDKLYKRAFHRGLGSTDLYRGLYSQANAVEDAKGLQRLKQQAINTDDSQLLRAVHHVAYDREYNHLLNDADESVLDLLEFEESNSLRKSPDRTRQFTQRLAASMRTTAPNG